MMERAGDTTERVDSLGAERFTPLSSGYRFGCTERVGT